jgi:hypothetical protein
MSKWLSSVNNLLEKLDDTAEAVAEERRATGDEDALPPAPEIEEILAKRTQVKNKFKSYRKMM